MTQMEWPGALPTRYWPAVRLKRAEQIEENMAWGVESWAE
jgi:hypothetical protein